MADQLQVFFSRSEFLSLANRAGFDLSEADLAQLVRRNLLRPCQPPPDQRPSSPQQQTGAHAFHLLHLYLLVRYFEAVRPTRHPWSAVAPDLTLHDVNQESLKCQDLLGQLIDDEAAPEADALSQWASSARTHAEKINPFGPLTDVVGLLGDEGRGELRGHGLLYVRLLELADELETLSAAEASELSEASEPSELSGLAEFSEPLELSEPIDAGEPHEDEEREDEEREDEEREDEEREATNPFSRQSSEVTSRSKDLQSRLDQLRSHDEEVARKRGQTPDEPSETVAKAEEDTSDEDISDEETSDEETSDEETSDEETSDEAPDNVHQRIQELNRLRETYLAEQRWEDLAELYEDGIELFVEPVERQQVFLTLAMLYEVKLKRLDSAFEKFVAAYLEQGAQKARDKAFKGLQRLGRQSSIQARFIGFLEDQLADDELDEAHRSDLRRLLALALHSAGQWQRAFFTYTAFLAEASQVDERALDDLEKLAGSVDAEELGDFYADLFSHRLPQQVFEPMAVRAARHHADRGEIGLAMEYYERVLDRQPDHEVAFHSLAHLYEDAGRLARLVELYERKIVALEEAAPASLVSELERIQALVQPARASD